MSAFVCKPASIGAAQLIATTATETVAAYNPATAYAAGEQVRVDADKRIYQSLQASNTGNAPATSPLWWVDVAPTNTWAFADNQVSTATTATASLSLTLAVGYANTLGLFGLVGTALSVTVRDGLAGPVVYTRTQSLDAALIADWYAYFFEPAQQVGEVVLNDLPPYLNAHVTVEVTGSGAVAIGHLSLGTAYDLGNAEYGISAEVVDYSRVDTDEFGETTFVRRKSAKNIALTADLPLAQMRRVFANLDELRGTPCVWAVDASETFAPFAVFAAYRGARVVVPGPTHCTVSLDLKGLT